MSDEIWKEEKMTNQWKEFQERISILTISGVLLSFAGSLQGSDEIPRASQHYYQNLQELVVTEHGSVITVLGRFDATGYDG